MIKLMLLFHVQDGFTPLAVALQQGHANDKTNVNVSMCRMVSHL